MKFTVAGKTIVVHDREEWQLPSRPVKGPAPYPNLVHYAVIHWPGASSTWVPPKTTAQTAAHLRWSQDMYLNDPKRGYSYGYSFVIGQTPINWNAAEVLTDIWEVRGTDIRPAANNGDKGIYDDFSNPNFNGRSIPIQLTASAAHAATHDQIEQARYMVSAMDQVYAERLTVIPHRTSDSTTCPGDFINSKIAAIAVRPEWKPTTPPVDPAPPPTGVVAVEPFGTFIINETDRWPAQVAQRIYGNAELWPWIANFNSHLGITQENVNKTWPAIGVGVRVPPLPESLGSKSGPIAGVRVRVPYGAGPAAIVGVAFPNESFQQRSARVPEMAKWNGRTTSFRAGQIVFVRA